MNTIDVKQVTKRYGGTLALNQVSLQLQQGKIYGLLGRNGAGKSSLLNIITGRIFADSGSVHLGGSPVPENDEALKNMYMLSEATYYPSNMKAEDAFKWSASFYPDFELAYAQHLAQQFKLPLKKRVSSLSTGYRTIFKLVVALSTNASFVLLDEPVLGLDANHRDLFYKSLLEKYAQHPACYVLSTHLVEEVSGIIEDVIIIKDGSILTVDTRENLLQQGYAVNGSAALVDEYIAGKQVLGVDAIGGLKQAYLLGTRPGKLPQGLEISGIDLQRLFIQLTN